ncbi:NAD(P)H-dependent oxidoreductase [Actinocorallia aurea]
MPHLLHLDTSPSETSVSRELARTFRAAWAEANPEGTITYRDLASTPVPHLAAAGVTAGFTPPAFHSPAEKEATALREELITELLAADTVLVSTPMYNWSVPSTLKAWIDQVLVNDRTLSFDGSPGPLAGRPATVLASYGGGYMPGAPRENANHCGPYLETVFGLGLGMETEIIAAHLSLAPRVPAMADLVPLAEKSRAAANIAAADRARAVASVLV